MKNKTTIALIGIASFVLGIGIYFSGLLDQSNTPAPDTTFKLITGDSITLGSLKGKPVMVVFWATTCKICIKEIPDLIELHHTYADKGLHIIAVAMPYDHPAAVVKLAKKMKLPYKVALDVDAKVLKAFIDVQVTPTIFLIANEGYILMRAIGKLKLRKLKQLIDNQLAKQHVTPANAYRDVDGRATQNAKTEAGVQKLITGFRPAPE